MELTFYVKDFLRDTTSDSDAVDRCFAEAEAVTGHKVIVFDGKDYALDGSAGWFGYVYPAGAAVSEVSLHAGESGFENSLIPACGLVLTVR